MTSRLVPDAHLAALPSAPLAEREPPLALLALLARHFPDLCELRQDSRFLAILRELDVRRGR
jgi:hypothetical protein